MDWCMSFFKTIPAVMLMLLISPWVFAQNVSVTNAWARASVKGQNATGVFMNLKASSHTRLVAVNSSVAKVSEIHQMNLDNNVMKMSALPNGLELGEGRVVELKPGGFHIMLFDLKKTLQKDSKIDLQLTFQDATGKKTQMDMIVPVLLQANEGPNGKPGAVHPHH